jgi:hypothetical protein
MALFLEVHHIMDAFLYKYMMATPYPLLEAETIKETAKVTEINVRVGPSSQNSDKQLAVTCHAIYLLLCRRRTPRLTSGP